MYELNPSKAKIGE
ncbi:Protein of unknown function [Bacillus cereus]|nr:Protein of unknown function [Bacillus cereus]